MRTPAHRPDVERLRNRLNLLVLVVAGQFLPIVAAYWLRFVPAFRPLDFVVPPPEPGLLLACAAALALPFVLPHGWFTPRPIERRGLYDALGLRRFRALATDGDWINSRLRRLDPTYRVIRDRRTRDAHLAGTILNERWHSAGLLLGAVTAGSAMATGQYGWAVTITVFNAAFNLYPVLHQRYKRARLRPAKTVRRTETQVTRSAMCLALLLTSSASLGCLPGAAAIDARVRAAMAETHANGLAIAVIDDGRVAYVQAYGARNAKGDPLQTDTVMYGASLTKTVMAYTTLTLVDQGALNLDAPLAEYLEQPLTSYGEGRAHVAKYGPYRDLADDQRWRTITARMALTHSTGFHNFWFIEPDRKLRIHFDPGSRFSYSGEGFSLLQFIIEQGAGTKGLGLDVKALTDAIFVRLGMTRTSLQWRADFRPNLADGWNDTGEPQAHDERSNVRVAGSMDTTISDLATFIAALVRGDGLSLAARAEMVKPSLHIGTAHQFPNFAPYLPEAEQRPDLAAGLGVIVFEGPQGRGFYKGGHDGQTANSFVCLERRRRCVLLLANDVRAEARFADLVRFVLGETGVPYDWEYADRAGQS